MDCGCGTPGMGGKQVLVRINSSRCARTVLVHPLPVDTTHRKTGSPRPHSTRTQPGGDTGEVRTVCGSKKFVAMPYSPAVASNAAFVMAFMEPGAVAT